MRADCDQIRDLMGARLGDELPEAHAREMDRHLAECRACERHWREMRETLATVQTASAVSASPELRGRVRGLVAGEWDRGEAAAPMAEVVMTHGVVRRREDESLPWMTSASGDSLAEGETLEVGEKGRALLRLPDRSELWVNAGTLLRLTRRAATTAVRLARGEVLALMEKQRRAFRILTADGAVEVVGTIFNTRTKPGEGTRVSVLRGRVRVSAGAQRREVGPRRRVHLSAQQGLGRTGRLSAAEMRRLSGWAEPMRRGSRASGEKTLDTVRKETAMSTFKKFVGAAAVLGLALIVFANLWSPAPPSVEETIADAETRAAAARRIEIAEPVQLNLVPQSGDTWRQTALFRGEVAHSDFFNAEQATPGEMRWVTEVRARAGEDPGQVIVDHRVVEVSGQDDLSQVHPRLHEGLRREAELRQAAFARSSYVEVLDSLGRHQDVVANIDFGVETGSEYVCHPVFLALLSTPTGAPDGPITAGSSWTVERPLIFHEDLTATIRSTLDHFEEMDGERVAVIRSEVECHSDEPVELLAAPEPHTGQSKRLVRERLDMSWSQEARHRLSDGRRLMATGQFDIALIARIEAGPPGNGQETMVLAGAPQRDQRVERQSVALRFDFATVTESSRPRVVETRADIRTRSTEARRFEITEPLDLNLLPRPGDTWTQTTVMRGQETDRDFFNADQTYGLEVRLVSEARVREGLTPGEIIIEHAITDTDLEIDLSAFPEPARAEIEQIAREREASMMGAVVRETLDAQGRRVGVEMSIPDIPPHALVGMEMAMSSLMIPPACTGTQPLAAGASWTQVDHIPSLGDFPIPTTSTLERLEELEGERVAVIRSASELHFDASRDGLIDLGVKDYPQQGMARFALQRYDTRWSGEDRHRLDDGRRLLTIGQIEMSSLTHVLLIQPGDQREERNLANEMSFDVVTHFEYPS